MKKPYFHELEQSIIDKIVTDNATAQYIKDNYLQPEWCSYPDALMPMFGCWSLMDLRPNGKRCQISNEFCKNCESYNLQNSAGL